MTTIEKAREFIDFHDIDDMIIVGIDWTQMEDVLQDHSKFTLQQVIDFIEINQDKSVKGIIQ